MTVREVRREIRRRQDRFRLDGNVIAAHAMRELAKWLIRHIRDEDPRSGYWKLRYEKQKDKIKIKRAQK